MNKHCSVTIIICFLNIDETENQKTNCSVVPFSSKKKTLLYFSSLFWFYTLQIVLISLSLRHFVCSYAGF